MVSDCSRHDDAFLEEAGIAISLGVSVFEGGGIAGEIGFGLDDGGFITGDVGFGLAEGGFKGAGVDVKEQVAFVYKITFLEVDTG